VAGKVRKQGIDVVWMGTRDGIEARLVPASGYDIEWVDIRGLRGTGLRRKLMMPLYLVRAMAQSIRILRRRRPDALLGMGGFAAGPGGLAGWLLRKPLLIHEANAIAGLTNRLLAPLARRVMTGFPTVAGLGRRTVWTGNPLRDELAAIEPPSERLAGRAGPLRLLVVGGSRGARALNELAPEISAAIADADAVTIRHQCGRGNRETVEQAYARAGRGARVDEFIDDMAGAYRWADLVICRAGAMTVAEIAAAGVAAMLVPFPHAVGDHQTANARYLADRGGALLVPQSDAEPAALAATIVALYRNRGRLLAMAERAREAARPDASDDVARHCLEVLDA
jgi:UDP-N-acetylglucosamine--N-acetylmuramyl-(pentapeptide) pyrophosphoryl-undecaprenol N-acetylglucosamine transferase